jgi:hypothetical protein
MKLIKPNWYGFDHAEVNKQFGGDLSFCNDFCVNDEYNPSAVYFAANPDRTKGHKDYMLLSKNNDNFYVRGMTPTEIEKFRYQDAIHCISCDDVVYSINRHDYRPCSCGKVTIDGGKDYTKVSHESNAFYNMVTIDLLTDIITETKQNDKDI